MFSRLSNEPVQVTGPRRKYRPLPQPTTPNDVRAPPPGLIFVEGRKRSFSRSSLVFCSLRLPVILVSAAISCTFPSTAESTRMEDTLHPVHIQTQTTKKTTQKGRWPISELKIQFMAACESVPNKSFRSAGTCISSLLSPVHRTGYQIPNHCKDRTEQYDKSVCVCLNISQDWLHYPRGKNNGSSFSVQLGSYFVSPLRGRGANKQITQSP